VIFDLGFTKFWWAFKKAKTKTSNTHYIGFKREGERIGTTKRKYKCNN
jgi:hypothetical protein